MSFDAVLFTLTVFGWGFALGCLLRPRLTHRPPLEDALDDIHRVASESWYYHDLMKDGLH